VIASEPLTQRQHRAIAALLTEDTQEAAARSARVGVRTLRRWMDVPAFGAELARQRDRLVGAATLRLARASDRAATALDRMADGAAPPNSARVAACKAILEGAIALIEFTSMSDRVAALERAWALSVAPVTPTSRPS